VDDLHQLSMSDEGALAYQKAPVDVINVLEVPAAPSANGLPAAT
jgi:two-component system sensor histidine kinase BaeS